MLKNSIPIVAGVAVVLGCVGLGANAAYAHDDTFTPKCDGASLNLTNYPSGSTVAGTVDGVSYGPIAFGPEGFHGSVPFDPAVEHSWDITVKSGDGNHRYDHHYVGKSDPACIPTLPPVTPPPTDEPSTPPTTPPAEDVIKPHIQDYITCKGGAFVLDNTGSTVAVEYSVNGLIYNVPAGTALHTDADGTIIQPNSDYEGYTIKAGDKTWNFASKGNCATIPPVQPTQPPTDTPTSTPSPTGPSTAPTGSPTHSASTPPVTTTTPTGTNSPTHTSPTRTDSGTTPKTHSTDDTARTLAYTGTDLKYPAIAAAVLVLLGLGGYVFAIIRKRRFKNDN